MRINEDTLLEGEHVVLVPYNPDHVPRYHQWMSSSELQKLTASAPLTLEEEYDMQRSWREDDDKCTFIILDKQQWADPTVREEDCMVGDVNIFLTDPEDPSLGELEIMIAALQLSPLKGNGLFTVLCLYFRSQLQRQRTGQGGHSHDDMLWGDQTWHSKVRSQNWNGQQSQHRPVQEISLPGGILKRGVPGGNTGADRGRSAEEVAPG
ncbi:alpha/beta-tubulin-N-acetyltransferase 9 isoform X2 [Amia ocellicauda]|uniref:alpha/beta-tubulin-N-acetyltransferase 9 isoform X2 n=1 Tax=Amia ocellicauda TaxID=2972642 RepID=UPI003464879B